MFKAPASHDWDFLLPFFFLFFFLPLFKDVSRKFALPRKLLLPCKKNILTICWRPFYATSRRLTACIISGIPGVCLIPSSLSLPFIHTSRELCRPSAPVTDNGFPPLPGACARKRMEFFPPLLMHGAERKPCNGLATYL